MSSPVANCPNCGAPVVFRWSSAVQTTCEFCHSILVRTDVDLQKVGEVGDLPPDASPIQIGSEGTLVTAWQAFQNSQSAIPASFARCESTGRVKNFEMAATHTGKFCTIFPFDDTDIYKTIEGASYSLKLFADPKLEKYLDSLITIVGKAQEPDGYLYTARTIDPAHPHPWSGKERWVKEREMSHELYNAGHLYEAAVAHYMATGKKNFLNIYDC